MLRTSENETEILLGNKQLLGIFFVAAILLGLAFYGGYVIGRGSARKTPPPATTTSNSSPAASLAIPATGGETHSVPADSGAAPAPSDTSTATNAPNTNGEPPLGSPKRKNLAKSQPPAPSDVTVPPSGSNESNAFTPKPGQTFLQVTAVGRDEAIAIADVLHKKGFPAHAVPKPGSSKLYRVLVGPLHDAGDLSSTRESLRRTGFREVIVQRY